MGATELVTAANQSLQWTISRALKVYIEPCASCPARGSPLSGSVSGLAYTSMENPPGRLSTRQFTLAYAVCSPGSSSSWPLTERLLIIHIVRRRHQDFALVGCDAAWGIQHSTGYHCLPELLLMAREEFGLALASWDWYEPPRGQKLFENDPLWVRRRHRNARRQFMGLRWRFRWSNRLTATMKLSRPGP